ncbi:MAG: hypothetical protein ACYCS1_11565 [Gammaproteobacteria bacterium]
MPTNRPHFIFESAHYSIQRHCGGLLITRHDGRSILLQAGDDSQPLHDLLESDGARDALIEHTLGEYFACLSSEVERDPHASRRPGF